MHRIITWWFRLLLSNNTYIHLYVHPYTGTKFRGLRSGQSCRVYYLVDLNSILQWLKKPSPDHTSRSQSIPLKERFLYSTDWACWELKSFHWIDLEQSTVIPQNIKDMLNYVFFIKNKSEWVSNLRFTAYLRLKTFQNESSEYESTAT